MSNITVKALCFDVFGTVTDWHGSISREGDALCASRGVKVPWGEFVNKWRLEGYFPTLFKIASGEVDYISTEQIHRTKLLELLQEYGLQDLSEEASLNQPIALTGANQFAREYTARMLSLYGRRSFGTHLTNAELARIGLRWPLTATRYWARGLRELGVRTLHRIGVR